MKKSLRQRVLFAFDDSDSDVISWTKDFIQKVICFYAGHVPERDQCGRPEHDFCLWCRKSMPYAYTDYVIRKGTK